MADTTIDKSVADRVAEALKEKADAEAAKSETPEKTEDGAKDTGDTENTEDTDTENTEEEAGEDEDEAPAADLESVLKSLRKKNRENQNLRKRVKDAEENAKDASTLKTDNQRLATENMRLTVAVNHGLPMELAKRLVGQTVEEMEADAADMLKLFAKSVPASSRPRENLKPVQAAQQGAETVEELTKMMYG
ncbi:hypothetical protein [Actinomyces sp.]|uniref:hypothetical protein n=1 Tax=Actinomyces sp. TaxID=29317 RepID=UPI002913C8C4|nr:hypothetical protein [Actinomyces sp.]MDU7239807.1 hypothetical protein [Actinomyces sp.]